MLGYSSFIANPVTPKQLLKRRANSRTLLWGSRLRMNGTRVATACSPLSQAVNFGKVRIRRRLPGAAQRLSKAKQIAAHLSPSSIQETSKPTTDGAKLSIQILAAVTLACSLLLRSSGCLPLLGPQLAMPSAVCMGFVSVFLRPSFKRLSRGLTSAFSHSAGQSCFRKHASHSPRCLLALPFQNSLG